MPETQVMLETQATPETQETQVQMVVAEQAGWQQLLQPPLQPQPQIQI